MTSLRACLVLAIASTVLACGDSSPGTGGSAATGSTTNATSGTASTSAGTTSGTATTSSSTGQGGAGGIGPAGPECEIDADCKLVDDCCRCEAIPTRDTPPVCNQQCVQSKCSELQLPQGTAPSCVAGRCVAGFQCDWNQATCLQPTPVCPAGETGSIMGLCYGPCVPAGECLSVGTCGQCDGGLACVTDQAQLQSVHCVNLPAQCTTADCACLGPSVCVGAFNLCADAAKGVDCSCPTCGMLP